MQLLVKSVRAHPHKDENLSVSDSVFALGDPDHGELTGTLALLHQVTDLRKTVYGQFAKCDAKLTISSRLRRSLAMTWGMGPMG